MATIHVSEIQKILADRGEKDALPWAWGGYFLEIRFDDPARQINTVDEELKNKVITTDCPYGIVTILFDKNGELQSIEIC
ncbi:MAG: hypothetical protein EA357_10790 [Micavibrio sp.]|nr:MAG: hypothetical protein EA357_10790 [Micavibrio sp.]